MQSINDTTEDISHKASGHNANLSNPDTLEAAKEHSKDILNSMPNRPHYGKAGERDSSANPNQVAGGLKA